MPGIVAAPQLPKNGVEPAFVRGVRRRRLTSEEEHSDDSERSKHSTNGGEASTGANKKQKPGDDKMDEEEKRKNFLERNRQAALKCRQRKKQWLSNLQAKVEYLTTDNEHLQNQTAALRDEIIHLKALLLAHKDCPIAQANGVYAETIGMAGHGGIMTHGRPPHPMQQQPQHHQQHQQAGLGPGRGGPSQQRGGLPPPPPPPSHHHLPVQGGPGQRIMNQSIPASGVVGAMAGAPGPGGRSMSMMQDITPNASPSQSQVNVRPAPLFAIMSDRAWVTYLSNTDYLMGCLVLAHSLRKVESKYPLVVMVPSSPPLASNDLEQLKKTSNIIVEPIDISIWQLHISSPSSPPMDGAQTGSDTKEYLWDYYAHTWAKLGAWGLFQYRRLVLLDCDMLVRINMDQLLNDRAAAGSTQLGIKNGSDDHENERKLQLGHNDAYLDLPDDWIAASHACTCNPMRNVRYPKA
ncbi:hypothetical protein BGZ72_001588, partial [Mortierella alpina]